MLLGPLNVIVDRPAFAILSVLEGFESLRVSWMGGGAFLPGYAEIGLTGTPDGYAE